MDAERSTSQIQPFRRIADFVDRHGHRKPAFLLNEVNPSDARLREAGARAIGVPRREVLLARGDDAGPGFNVDLAYAWVAVHGFASLQIDRHLRAIDPSRATPLLNISASSPITS